MAFGKKKRIAELQEQSSSYLERAKELNEENKALRKNLEEMKKREVEASRKKRKLSQAEQQFYTLTTDLMEIKKKLELSEKGQLGQQESPGVSAMAEKLLDKLSAVDYNEISMGAAEDLTIAHRAMLDCLGSFGFRNNTQLQTIGLPADMAVISRSFFYGCSKLQAITIPASVRKIEDYAFYGCEQLGEICFTRNSQLQEIGDFAFAGCTSLSRITLPAGLKSIGTAAFRNCHRLSAIQMEKPDGVTRIGSHAFQHCVKLGRFHLPKGLKEVETSLFYGCDALTELRIPASVQLVQNYAFCECGHLRLLGFGSEKTHLMPLALQGVPETTLIELHDGRQFIRNAVARHIEGQAGQAAVQSLARPETIFTVAGV